MSAVREASEPEVTVSFEIAEKANREFLSLLLQQQRQGHGVLPTCLGLSPLDFVVMVQGWLPEASDLIAANTVNDLPGFANGKLRQELLDMRREELQDVRDLLLASRSHYHPMEIPMAQIIAAGCLGGDHLWRDLGLPSRQHLGELLQLNFAPLAARNVADMKWKKFFYKQLCEQSGSYVCRSPSCEQCVAYDDCFGSEE